MTTQEGGSLAEQLASVLPRLRGARAPASGPPACRVALRIPADDLDGAFGEVRNEALRWMQNRAGRRLPDEAWRGEGFELAGAGPLRAEAAPEADGWTARLDEADGDAPDLSWTTEIEVARDGEAISAQIRLVCAAPGESPPARSVPGLVRWMADRFGVLSDGRPVGAGPRLVDTPERVEKFVALLCDPERRQDVLAIATGDRDGGPSAALVSPRSVFERTLGAAHVAAVTATASFALTDLVGKELSVFHQAARTYRPGFDLWRAEPRDHPLTVGARISDWAGGPEAFEDFLVAACLRAGAADGGERPPASSAARRTAPAALRAPAAPAVLSGGEGPDDALRRENEDLRAENQKLAEALGKERSAAAAARKENRSLKDRVAHLERAQGNAPARPDGPAVPDSFKRLEQWAKEHLDGRVRLLPRAVGAAKKSAFEDVALAYRALLILRDRYVPMRLDGGNDKLTAYREALLQEGLREEPTFAGARAGEHGDAYFVRHGGRKRQLERHLKGSNARNERRGFRLYFFWDESDREVVVGWLPTHLPTRIS